MNHKASTRKLAREIMKMADSGKFVLGICSGFQILAKETDVGRLSTMPITREGLGLLDAEFKPLICTDRVTATVLTKASSHKKSAKKFQVSTATPTAKSCCTKTQKPSLFHMQNVSTIKKDPQDLISGVANKQGNVVGIFIHGLLDQNPTILESITKSLDINAIELEADSTGKRQTSGANQKRNRNRNQHPPASRQSTRKQPRLLMVTATGSGSGKTFIVAGIAGALKKQRLQSRRHQSRRRHTRRRSSTLPYQRTH